MELHYFLDTNTEIAQFSNALYTTVSSFMAFITF